METATSKLKLATILLIVALTASSLIMIESAFAQSITKPSIPEFTIKYVDYSYDIPPTYGTDPYNGDTVITKAGEHVDNRTIEITIENQPFTPFTDASNGRLINLYYNVRYKGSFEKEWSLLFGEGRIEWLTSPYPDPYRIDGYPSQDSASQYTIVSHTLSWNVPSRWEIDFQVEALMGYVDREVDPERSHMIFRVYDYTFYGEESGWSNTKTMSFPDDSVTTPTSPNPTSTIQNSTSTPTQPTAQTNVIFGLGWEQIVIALLVVVAVLAVALIFAVTRKAKRNTGGVD